MPIRASALRALNLLVNANDAESGGSDESDVDFDLEDLDSEDEYLVSDYSSDDECESEFDEPIECSSDQQPPSGQSTNLDKTSKAGVHWTKLDDGDETCIRKRIVFNEKSGPTSFAASRIDSTALSAFLVIFDLSMVKMVLDCTNAFAESVDPKLSFKKEEILAFIGLLLSRGVFCPGIPIKEIWSSNYGIPIIKNFMSRNRYFLLMKYLRFDNKSTRSERVKSDTFCMARDLWERLIENSKACYRPNQFLTVDEQLLAMKCRCSFLQYMPNKPDKFGIKFWLLVDVISKFILNGFPYLGKNHDKPNNELQGEYVVKKLIEPYKNKGYCVSSDNFFTTYRLASQLLANKTTFIGTVK